MAFDPSEWEVIDSPAQAQPQFDPSEWEVVSGPQAQSAPQQPQLSGPVQDDFWGRLKNNTVAAANSALFGFGDEAAAGVRSLIPGYGNYDQELAAIRGGEKDYATLHPYSSAASSLAGAIVDSPLLASGVAGRATLAGRLAQGAAEGVGYGGVAGFGSGEGGLAQRADSAENSAELGMLLGPAAQLFGEGMAAAGGKLGAWGEAANRKSIGARQSDYARTADDMRLVSLPNGEDPQTFTKYAIDDLLSRNELGSSRNAPKMLAAAEAKQKDLSQRVGELVQQYDQAGLPPVQPQFKNALDYLASGKVPADKIDPYLNRLANLQAEINNEGKGALAYTQRQKVALGNEYSLDDKSLNAFNRQVYRDLQGAVEDAIPVVKPLNDKLSEWETVLPILRRNLAGSEAKNPIQSIFQALRTSGGVGSLLLGGAASGNPLLGAMAGGALYAATPRGMSRAGAALRGTGAVDKFLGAGLSSGIPTRAIQALAAPLIFAEQSPSDAPEYRRADPTPSVPSSQGLQRRIGSGSQVSAGARGSPYTPRISYDPTPSNSPAQESGSYQGSDPLIRAIIRVESSGNPRARSKAGAEGLMQLMPAIQKHFGVTDPFDPEQNVAAGTKLLKEEMGKYGDLALALASYNAGDPKVDAAIRRAGSKDWSQVKKFLPRETQTYVYKIAKALSV